MNLSTIFNKRNRRILFWSSLIGFGVFYYQTWRPIRKQRYQAEQEKIAEEVFKLRYPDLAAQREITRERAREREENSRNTNPDPA